MSQPNASHRSTTRRSYTRGLNVRPSRSEGKRGEGGLTLIQLHRSPARRLSRAGLEPTLSSRPTARMGLRILKRLRRHSFAEANLPPVFLSSSRRVCISCYSSRRLCDYYRLASAVTCAVDAVFLIVCSNVVADVYTSRIVVPKRKSVRIISGEDISIISHVQL